MWVVLQRKRLKVIVENLFRMIKRIEESWHRIQKMSGSHVGAAGAKKIWLWTQNDKHWHMAVAGAWLCTLIGVVTLSLLPETNPAVAHLPPALTNLAHVPAYALLTILTIITVAIRVRVSPGILVAIVLSVSLFAGAIEILQPLTGRTASMADEVRSIAGTVLAVWGYRAWTARRSALTKNSAAKSAPLSRPIRVAAVSEVSENEPSGE